MKRTAAERKQIEAVMRLIPGFDPWDLAGEDCWFEHDAAVQAINFFADRLKHVEGSAKGVPFVLRGWQAAVVGNIFGWKRKDEDGRTVRRFRKVLIWIGRGNGKTPLCAGIMLCAQEFDQEAGAQNYLAAGTKEQSGFMFRNLKGFIEQDDDLTEWLTIYGGNGKSGVYTIVQNDDPLSSIKVIPSDASAAHGGIPHVSIIDELHVQESRDFLDVFETAMSKKTRAQPLLILLTTADYDRPSVCNEEYEYACSVRDNGGDRDKPGHDPNFLPVIYELSKEDDWRKDETTWIKANPNLDVSVSRESLRKMVAKCAERPGLANEVKRLHFNLRTSNINRIIPMDDWDECGKHAFDLEQLKGRRCIGGLDLSSKEDLSSLTLVFPGDDEWIDLFSISWCPEAKILQRAGKKIPYDRWHEKGYLIATTGSQIDYETIINTIFDLYELYDIALLGFDPAGATHLMQQIRAEKGEDSVCEVTQNMYSLSGPFKEFLRRIKLKKVRHGDNPLLRWTASNTAVHYKGRIPQGAKLEDHLDKVPILPSKQNSVDKIDPIAATITAMACLLGKPDAITNTGPEISFI